MDGLTTGFDLAEPEGRRSVLRSLEKIQATLLQEEGEGGKMNSCHNNLMGYLVVPESSL